MFGNATTFLYGLPLWDFSKVAFGPSTLQMIGQDNLASPSPQLRAIMMDTSWPVYVTDPQTIVFRMIVPFGSMMPLLSAPIMMIFDPTYMMAHGGPGTPGSPNPYFILNPPPGTGPYAISSVVENTRYVFQQNPTYWGRNLTPSEISANPILDPGHYQTIVANTVSDSEVRYLDLTQGRAQMADIEGSDIKTMLQNRNPQYGFVQYADPAHAGGVCMLAMNVHTFPTNDRNVRQAIAHAINYTAVIQSAVYGYGARFVGPQAPIYGKYYNPGNFPPYDYNVTEAEQYLAAAGYPMGKGLPTLTFNIDNRNPWETTAAEVIQANLAVMGINVNIVVMTGATFLSTYFQPYQQMVSYFTAPNAPQLAIDTGGCYEPDYMGPTDYFGQFVTNSSSFGNFAGYSSDATARAFKTMLTSNNETLIFQDLTAAQKDIYDQAPYAWLFLPGLPVIGGTNVYNTQYIHNWYFEPNLYGEDFDPLINTLGP